MDRMPIKINKVDEVTNILVILIHSSSSKTFPLASNLSAGRAKKETAINATTANVTDHVMSLPRIPLTTAGECTLRMVRTAEHTTATHAPAMRRTMRMMTRSVRAGLLYFSSHIAGISYPTK